MMWLHLILGTLALIGSIFLDGNPQIMTYCLGLYLYLLGTQERIYKEMK